MTEIEILAAKFAESEKNWAYETTGVIPSNYIKLAQIAIQHCALK